MNRASRRAAARFKSAQRAPRSLDPTIFAEVIAGSQQIAPAIADAAMLSIHSSFEELRNGAPSVEHSCHHMQVLAGTVNSGMYRAREIDEPLLIETMQKAVDAMLRAQDRYLKHGRHGFDGPGLSDIAYALEVYEEIMRISSQKQMVDAEKYSGIEARKEYEEQQRQAQPA